ncbi:hypothetical protein KC207_12440 [Phycicoccus sp. BSK3Z-2]|uniref:Tetratricopeptide repeat protein n=1 Tax=Phycicoccus avicenniae TaxID=2828860 RepID=A0A941I0G9_9MICO|nr:hypothetical protein [Phycicoccus avicenniae]MBR7744097.1 hypothetical protein [Phycicoccus avicenniae]
MAPPTSPEHLPDAPVVALTPAAHAEACARDGDVEGAVEGFRTAWPVVGRDPTALLEVATCLRVLVLLGNTDRALDALLPRLALLRDAPDGVDRAWCVTTAAWVLRHALRLGVAPETIDGVPTPDLVRDLTTRADDAATTDRRTLDAAHADDLVPAEPTLPPTRMPAGTPPPDRTVPVPADPADLPVIADRVRRAREQVDPTAERAVRGWLEARDALLPRLSTAEEWAAAARLERLGALLLDDPARVLDRLEDAAAAAERAGDVVEAAAVEAERATAAVRRTLLEDGPDAAGPERARAVTALGVLEATGDDAATADALRWYALTTRPPDAADRLLHAAALHERAGTTARRAVCLLDAATALLPTDEEVARALVEEAETLAAGVPAVAGQAADLAARVARARNDLEAAEAAHVRALEAARGHDRLLLGPLLALCDVLVERAAWSRLEPRAADALAMAVRLRDGTSLAAAQRHLALAYLETERPAEAAELLEAALPVVTRRLPALVGPTGWALGNALLADADPRRAEAAFATAAAAFEREGRLVEAGHSRHRAAVAAWEADDTDAATAHVEHALIAARMSGAVEVLHQASLVRAAVRAATVGLDVGVAELDEVLPAVARFAADRGEEEFDVEVHEPDVLRQGAHLLARGGRPEEALERLARAEALVGADYEIVLRAERGVVLVEAGRADEGVQVLRAVLPALAGAGLHDERVGVAQVLATTLDELGRPEESDETWAAFGPDA